MKNMSILLVLLSMAISTVAQPKFIAHRGASHLAPENTVSSANLAWQLGADAVEIDVHLSKDGKVMVIHDANTEKTSGEAYEIKDTESSVLRKLDVGSWKADKYSGEKIPVLEEVIETIPEGKTLVIEIKCGSEVLPSLKSIIDKSGKSDRITFIGFGWSTILDTKKAFPESPCYWLCNDISELNQRLAEVADNGLEGVNLYHKIIDEKIMQMANDNRLEVLTWTVDEPSEAERLVELGVVGITTNRPAWLKGKLIP
ncbi:glycerophosphodiester phosphodiesterase family protein [Sunxiuqinia sp. A32]|uniref:glycerophosphodiester phosphodiesterase family protein n=1 Tax=Sunxiuqinia sp. A32 TaxID=3461496 RepID=UPI00404634A8